MGMVCWNPRIWVNSLTYGWPIDEELVPGLTRCVVIWGVNPAESDRSMYWKTLNDFSGAGGNVIVIDPRRTETARLTEHWVSPKPGTDGALALGMLHVILAEELYDREFVSNWCSGFEALSQRVKDYSPEKVALLTGVPAAQIEEISRLYAQSGPASILTGVGIDQSGYNCTQTLRAIAALRAVTGNVDVQGASLLNDRSDFVSEVELELNDLMPPEQKAKKLGAELFHLQRHEGYEKMLCYTMLHGKQLPARYMTSTHPHLAWQAMITGEPYPIRALFCMASNPLLCQGDSKMVYQAMKGLDLLVALEKFMTPSAMLADYVLPITGGMEQPLVQMHGGVANIIYGGAAAIEPLYERRTDFDFWSDLGKRCGQAEHWPWRDLEDAMDDVMAPAGQSWQDVCDVGIYAPEPTYRKYESQGFATPSGKVELYSELLDEAGHEPLPLYTHIADDDSEYPFLLITGVRKQPYYSSEFRQIDSLRRKHPQPLAEVAVETADKLDLNPGDKVWIETAQGRIRHTLAVVEMHPDAVSVELGWWFPEQPAAEPELGGMWEANANVLTTADTADCDPILGQWNFRSIPCRIYRAVVLEDLVLRSASATDREHLLELLLANDMDCSEVPIEEFTLALDGDEIAACIRFENCGESTLLRPIVVAESYRGQGVGAYLLKQTLPQEKVTMLMARGSAVTFYEKIGFEQIPPEQVPQHQQDECRSCPDLQECKPQAMEISLEKARKIRAAV